MKTFALAALVSVSLGSTAFAGEAKTAEKKDVELSFTSLDVDGDGYLTTSEATEAASLFNAFKSLDVDSDGKLSADEFAKFDVAAGSKEGKATSSEDTSKG